MSSSHPPRPGLDLSPDGLTGASSASDTRPIAPVEEPSRAMKPPRFGIKELLTFVGWIALILMTIQALHPMVATGLILLGLCIFAHVAGNAVGMRLRSGAPRRTRKGTAPVQSHDYAPTTRLALHIRLGRTAQIATVLGSLAGSIGGGSLLAALNWNRATIANISLATVSCGVLGGLLGFWLSSFLQVLFQAWAEAHRNSDPHQR